jgi:haloalkane dehalogenase
LSRDSHARAHEPSLLLPHVIWSGATSRHCANCSDLVAFDFLGFGESAGATYSFGQQLGDLKAVVDALGLEKIIPVAHDSSGSAAIN